MTPATKPQSLADAITAALDDLRPTRPGFGCPRCGVSSLAPVGTHTESCPIPKLEAALPRAEAADALAEAAERALQATDNGKWAAIIEQDDAADLYAALRRYREAK